MLSIGPVKKNSSAKVSVILPMYNHEKFIGRAIESIYAQNYRPLQVIAIDDGSKDNTADIARVYLNKYLPTSVLICRKNKGAAETINEAIRLSDGEYINIINSDDEFEADRISVCLSVCLRYEKQLVYGGVSFVDENGKIAEEDAYLASIRAAQEASTHYPTLGFALMRNQLAISTGNLFFSRRLFDRLGGFRSYKYIHDWDFLLRSLEYNEPVYIDQSLYRYRFHPENSYKQLENIAGYETSEMMRNFISKMISGLPENYRAPSPKYWPGIFERLIREWNYEVYLPPRWRRPLTANELIR